MYGTKNMCVWEDEYVCIEVFVYVNVFADLNTAHNR